MDSVSSSLAVPCPCKLVEANFPFHIAWSCCLMVLLFDGDTDCWGSVHAITHAIVLGGVVLVFIRLMTATFAVMVDTDWMKTM